MIAKPRAQIIAGGSDLALTITQDLQKPDLIFIGDIATLANIKHNRHAWHIGSGATWDQCERVMAPSLPGFARLLDRFGSPQIRLRATIGGNLGNASPIADGPPVLLVLGTTVHLRRGPHRRSVPLEDFYLGYRKTVLRPGEFITSLRVAKPPPQALFAVHKVSKRTGDDISSVCGAFLLRFNQHGLISSARVAFGGMAATPCRARSCETALRGIRLGAIDALARASANYRSAASLPRAWSSGCAAQLLPQPWQNCARYERQRRHALGRAPGS